jgi:hypothetical protein
MALAMSSWLGVAVMRLAPDMCDGFWVAGTGTGNGNCPISAQTGSAHSHCPGRGSSIRTTVAVNETVAMARDRMLARSPNWQSGNIGRRMQRICENWLSKKPWTG